MIYIKIIECLSYTTNKYYKIDYVLAKCQCTIMKKHYRFIYQFIDGLGVTNQAPDMRSNSYYKHAEGIKERNSVRLMVNANSPRYET